MSRKVHYFARSSRLVGAWVFQKVVAMTMVAALLLPPLNIQMLAAEVAKPAAGPIDKPGGLEELMQSRIQERAATAAKVKIPQAHEFFKGDAPEVNAYGGRISLRNLDLSKSPSERELRQAGQLGSPLTPSGDADPAKIADPTKRRQQEDDNMLFGQAMQRWNEHAYGEAVKIFRQHRKKFASSPWAGEAELHLGCQAQFSGSWAEAKFSFEWILSRHKKGTDIYQKAKLRRAVLHVDQGELKAAVTEFKELLQSETNWERRTYATHWLQQLSLYKAHEVALRDCGVESVASILRSRGDEEKAAEVKLSEAPDQRGFSLGELTEFSIKAGLDAATAARFGFEDLDSVPFPFIAHYSDRHFVTVLRQDANQRLWIYDPRLKRETVLTREQFAEQWSGLGVLFGGLPEGGRLASVEEMAESYGGCCGLPRNENDLGKKCKKKNCGMPGWDVNPVNMNLMVDDVPMWFEEAVGPSVFLDITYNSQDSLNQLRPFGNKWSFAYATYALESPAQGGSGTVMIVMPDGRRDSYQPDGAGGYTAPVGVYNTLAKTSAYNFQLQLEDGTIYSYGIPVGVSGTTSLLLSITDRHGFALNFSYAANGNLTAITDNQNRQWSFSYNTQGYVSRINDPFGRNATFTYDTNGNLVGQTDMGGLGYGYTYDANIYLTSIIKPTGTTTFYIEPADGIDNMGYGYVDYTYPPYGGVMWQNYRITVTDPIGNKEEFYYDGSAADGWHRDKVQFASTASSAPKTLYNYSVVGGQGVISKITWADGAYRQYSNYNANRQPQTFLNERGKYQYFTYNTQGRLLTHTDARGNVTTCQYAANGHDLTQVTDALNHVILAVGYDARRNVNSVVDGLSRSTTVTYNAADQVDTITDPIGTVWTMQYDASYLLTTTKQGVDIVRSFTRDAYDRVASITNANGYTLSYTYDDLNRPLRTIYPDATFTENQWGCCVIEAQVDRASQTTTFVYNALNQLEIMRDAAGQFTTYQHDALGNLLVLMDAKHNVTQWQYNNRHWPLKRIYADNSSETYSYDGLGNRTSIVDALGVTLTNAYDDADNLISRSSAGLATVTYTYDALNRMNQMVDGIGTTTFGYDNAGQLTTIDGPWANDTVTIGYDGLGRATSRDIDGATDSVAVDRFGRVASATNPLGSFSYGYASTTSSNLTSTALPNGNASSFSYYGNGGDQRLREILHQNASAQTTSKFDYEYSVLGQIAKWTQQADSAGAQTYDFIYDLAGQLTSGVLKKVADGSIQKSYGYRYDSVGNRTNETIDTIVSQDTHNNLNQIVSRQSGTGILPIRGQTNETVSSVNVNGSAAVVRGKSFEGSASVTPGTNTVTVEATDLNGNTTTKQYQVAISGTGSAAMFYDLKGNLLNDGTKTYEWDVLNRLTAINFTGTSPAQRTEFTYNGVGQRVKIVEKSGGSVISEKRFIWIPGLPQPSEERDASNSVIKRFYVQGEQIAGNSYYYNRDHLGSVRELTDSTGALRARYDYDPYGRRSPNMVFSNAMEADFGFAGCYWYGNSELNLTMNRVYDATFGRWLSRDPIKEAGGMNLYCYVFGEPSRLIDPFGLDAYDSVSNFFAGAADALTFGLASKAAQGYADFLGLTDGGQDSVVDKCSDSYGSGKIAGTILGAVEGGGRLAYAGIAKASSMSLLRQGATLENAQAAISFRNNLKVVFNLGMDNVAKRLTIGRALERYGGDLAGIIKASGRTEKFLNALGADLAASSLKSALTDPCPD